MSEDRLDLSLFFSGEHELPDLEAQDIHTKKTLPVKSLSGLLTAEELGLAEFARKHRETQVSELSGAIASEMTQEAKSGPKHLGSISSLKGKALSETRQGLVDDVDTDGASLWSPGNRDRRVVSLVWKTRETLNFLDASLMEYAVDLDGLEVTSMANSPDRALIGFAHGEVYVLDHDTQVMELVYQQVRREEITAVLDYKTHPSCLFVTASGAAYICKSIYEPDQIRRVRQKVAPNTRHIALHHSTKEFVWSANDGQVFAGNLIEPERVVLRLERPVRRMCFSADEGLLYIVDDRDLLSVYSWVGDHRCLYQKTICGDIVALFVDDHNALYGIGVEGKQVFVDRLS